MNQTKAVLLCLCLLIIASPTFSQNKKKKKAKAEETEQKEEHYLKSASISGIKFRSVGPAITSGRIADFAV
ncbi:MAG: hypothetical protein AAFO07_26235, partial [Bacteroidota bacterium]